jgi:rubrerythrin
MILGDEAGMIKIGRFFNIDEIPAEQKKVNETYKDLTSPENGEIVKVIPVATADSDPDYSDGEMDDYIVLYKYKDTFRYAVLQTSTNPDNIGLFAFAHDVNGLESAYDFWSKHQIVSKNSSADPSSTDDSSETPEIPEEPNLDEPEVTQEAMFDAGFGNLRSKIAQALDGKFKVTNVGKGMNGKDSFTISGHIDEIGDVRTTVTNTGTGCEVISRGDEGFKRNFANISLSAAFEKIKELFDHPQLLFAESFNIGKLSVSRFYQESDEEESSDDEETLELPEMPDLDEDESDEETPETNTTEDESPDGLEGFGMDTSDIQNEFDPKDIEALNKLIAAESEAINDYFDASKDTRDEDLRTLFSDIGHEERFHLEQLMYAKSKLTGEKYEPRDPEVKAEYEELMNDGMDEETAAYTAMDKRSMLGEDDGDDSDMEELEQESAFITDALYRNEIITSQLTSNIINNPHDISKELGIIVEAFYQEAIDNVSSAPKQYTKIDSPLALLTKGLKVAVNGLTRMSAIIRDSMRKDKLTRARKREWIKKHGIMELFKSGIHLYLFDDNKNKMDLDTPCRYVDFLYRLTKAIGESCGVKLTAAAQHKTISNPIKFKDVNEGMYKLSQVIFNKTKVVVTDENKAALQNEFFGYSDEKVNVKVTHGTDQVVNDSGNIYNRLDACILVTKKYAEISIAVLDEIKKLEGDVNSVYYKNRNTYNKAMKNIKLVVDKYTQFISAMSHDLTELMKLDNGLLKMTRERDMTEQGGGKWEGPDIRVSKQTSSGTQYTKRKK